MISWRASSLDAVVTLRPHLRWYFVIGGVHGFATGVLVALALDVSIWLRLLLGAGLIGISLDLIGLARAKLRITPSGVELRNSLRRRTFGWREVDRLVLRRRWTRLPWVRLGHLKTAQGSFVHSDVLIANGRDGRRLMEELLNELNARIESRKRS